MKYTKHERRCAQIIDQLVNLLITRGKMFNNADFDALTRRLVELLPEDHCDLEVPSKEAYEHTPGRWSVDANRIDARDKYGAPIRGHSIVIAPDYWFSGTLRKEAAANLELMRSAPELLKQRDRLVDVCLELRDAFVEHQNGDLNDIPADATIDLLNEALGPFAGTVKKEDEKDEVNKGGISQEEKTPYDEPVRTLYYVERRYSSGWADAEWTENDIPMRFASRADAVTEIEEHIAESMRAAAEGNIGYPERLSDYRVAEVRS